MRGLIPNAQLSEAPAPVHVRPGLTITNIDIPFGRMVELLIMWSLAAIVAGLALGILLAIPALVIRALLSS